MFRFQRVTLTNFMSIDSLELDFDDNQITAITGQNGSGKSSLLSAIAFCLTGYRKGDKAQDYVKTGTECATIHLEATFKGYPIVYDVTIAGPNPGRQTSRKQVVYKDTVYLNSDYNTFIKENNLDDLEGIMFMFQNTEDIINVRPSTRADTLKKIFNFDLESRTLPLKENSEEKKTVLNEINGNLNELRNRNYEKQKLLREVIPSAIEKWESRVYEIDGTLMSLGKVDSSDLEKCDKSLVSIQSELDDLNSKLSNDIESIAGMEQKIFNLKESLSKFDSDKMNSALDVAKSSIESHKIEYDRDKVVFDKLNKELSVLKYKLKEVKEQIKTSEKSGVCHACGHIIDQNHIDCLNSSRLEVEKSIEAKNKEISDLNFDSSDSKSKELNSNLKVIEDAIKKYESSKNELSNVETRLSNLKSVYEERENRKKKISSEKEELLVKKEELSKLKPLIEQKENLVNEKSDLVSKINTARENSIKNNERRKMNETIDSEIKKRDSRIMELSEKSNNVSMEINDLKVAIELIEKDFSNYIIIKACSNLSEYINLIVQRVFPYMKVKLSQSRSGVNFYYTCESSEDEWLSVSMASGAQRQVLSLAYKMAIAKFYNMECLCLDEIDASCSPENAGIIYKFLAGLEDFPQIIFISHRQEALQAMRDSGRTDIVNYYVSNGEYTLI